MALRLPWRLLWILAAVVAAALVVPAVAWADGDPASDVLLGENVFYPYSPAVSGPIQKQLNAAAAAAKQAGAPVKVALIAKPTDLGVVPDLFGKPQQYAKLLDQEISFRGKQPLLVVMPSGYGVQGLSAQATSMIAALARPASGNSNDLAQAAITAVRRIAVAEGHPLGNQTVSKGSGNSGGSRTVLLVGLVVAAIAAAAALVLLRRRAATRR
jgi:hypothetical protein